MDEKSTEKTDRGVGYGSIRFWPGRVERWRTTRSGKIGAGHLGQMWGETGRERRKLWP